MALDMLLKPMLDKNIHHPFFCHLKPLTKTNPTSSFHLRIKSAQIEKIRQTGIKRLCPVVVLRSFVQIHLMFVEKHAHVSSCF